MIDVTFSLTEPEFVEAQLLSVRVQRRSEFRKRWLSIFFYVAILVVLVPGTLLLAYAKLSHDPSIGLSLPFLSEGWFLLLIGLFELQVAYALFDLLTLKHVKKQIKKLFLQDRPGQTNTNLKIDNEGWLDQTPGSATFVE